MNYLEEEMLKFNADGIDFIPVWLDKESDPPIICSYTFNEFRKVNWIPKSNWRLWRIVDGKKVYIKPW
jgi:hypothetical protein